MCGIAGFVSLTPSAVPAVVIERMTDSIRHRGPDDSGYFRDRFAELGHRRLSIIDVSSGHQPMFNEDGGVCIVFNGEIFNHAALRPDLERAGHRYRNRSDTETILHAYEEYGADCVTRFRGMFAFAIWRAGTRTLFCARDRMGIKPFYYYWDGHLFAFASEIKALLEHPAISATFDESLLSEYLAFGYSSGDRTLFAGIRKLMPGHSLTLSPEGLDIRRYWQIPLPSGTIEDRDDADWIAECRRRLEQTVEMRLMSDVPLGMFLSGGVDSSAIAALMARMVAGPVKTFAVGYREAEFSELSYASHVASAIGTDHHEVVIGGDQFFAALPKLIWHEDEPIAWPSSVSLYFVSKLASERVKVVLTGEGADELFGGYGRYGFYVKHAPFMKQYARMPGALRRWLRSSLDHSSLLSAKLRRQLQHTVLGHEPAMESFYLDNFYSAFSSDEQRALLRSPDAGENPFGAFREHWDAAAGASLLTRLLYADQKTYLVELLMKQDQMSMACSIESRVPFLDHPFVEFASTVPDRLKIHAGDAKYILKRAVDDLLPRDIIYRKKMGFPTPLRQWLAGPPAAHLVAGLSKSSGFVAEYVDLPVLNTLLARHANGQIDATDRIWRLLNLQLWGEMFFSGRKESAQLSYDENPVGQN